MSDTKDNCACGVFNERILYVTQWCFVIYRPLDMCQWCFHPFPAVDHKVYIWHKRSELPIAETNRTHAHRQLW